MGFQILNFLAYYIAVDVVLSTIVAIIFRRRLAQIVRIVAREALGVNRLESRISFLEGQVDTLHEQRETNSEELDSEEFAGADDDEGEESDSDSDEDPDAYSA
jgi:hypothetical protein